jgi:uncharacterized protein (DUF885 family)
LLTVGGKMQNQFVEAYRQIEKDEWEIRLRFDPLFATRCGERGYNDRLPHVTPAAYARRLDELKGIGGRLTLVEADGLPPGQALNHAILSRLVQDEVDELSLGGHYLPISKTSGFHLEFPELDTIQPLENVVDYEAYLSRLQGFEKYVRQFLELMQEGVRRDYKPARVTLEGVVDQINPQMVSAPQKSPLFRPFLNFPASVSGVQAERLAHHGAEVIQKTVIHGFRALRNFILNKYLPNARSGIAACELPNGMEFYRHRIRMMTSLDLSPEAIHAIGREEVRRIRGEMEAVIHKTGFWGDLAAFIHYLRTDTRFYAATPHDLLARTALTLKRIDGELPRLFGRLPRTPYGIREIPEYAAPGSTTAYYFPPSGDGTKAGFYYLNTYDLSSRPFYEIEALSLHEAVPGHHLQIALQQELDLPPFRRFGGYTAFVEGWALYAERLGLETGFYTDPYSDFGRLSYEMWRACRLVVDTGMHALGWTRQQAIDFMAENTSLTLLNIANEVDRYIAWPGQALAYKLGELKIRELRSRAETALGPRFDLRLFHDELLKDGAVPLDVLEAKVEAAIQRWRPG